MLERPYIEISYDTINQFMINLNYIEKRFICQKDNQQETVIKRIKRPLGKTGSSETTRGNTTFYMSTFVDWFIGFTEGSCCCNNYNNKKDSCHCGSFTINSKQNRLMFIIRQKDGKVLYKIKDFFKFGSICCDKNNIWSYTVSKPKDLLTIINLQNGQLFLKKRIEQFEKWVKVYNEKYKTDIKVILLRRGLSLDSAWLCGFSDAKGSFNIRLEKNSSYKIGYRLKQRFFLSQSYSLECMRFQALILNGRIELKKNEHVRLVIDTYQYHPTIINYFGKFPPQTTKQKIRFLRYKKVFGWYKLKSLESRLKDIKHLIVLNKRLK